MAAIFFDSLYENKELVLLPVSLFVKLSIALTLLIFCLNSGCFRASGSRSGTHEGKKTKRIAKRSRHKGNYEVRKNGSKYHRSHSKSSYGSYNGGRRTSRRHSYHKHRKPRPGIISVGKRRPRTRRAMREEQKRKKKQQPEISIVELIGREILHMNIEAKHPNKDPKKVDRLVAFKRIDRHQKNDKNWLHHLMSENDSKKIDLKKSETVNESSMSATSHKKQEREAKTPSTKTSTKTLKISRSALSPNQRTDGNDSSQNARNVKLNEGNEADTSSTKK